MSGKGNDDAAINLDWTGIRRSPSLQAPATRAELLEALSKVQLAATMQLKFGTALLNGDRDAAVDALREVAACITSAGETRAHFMQKWSDDAKGIHVTSYVGKLDV